MQLQHYLWYTNMLLQELFKAQPVYESKSLTSALTSEQKVYISTQGTSSEIQSRLVTHTDINGWLDVIVKIRVPTSFVGLRDGDSD